MSTPASLPTMGFTGIGKLGLPMVEHLRKAGYSVSVHDVVPATALPAMVLACHLAETLGGCASQADALFNSMPHDSALETITGAGGGFTHGRHETIMKCDPVTSHALVVNRFTLRAWQDTRAHA